jgi:hypothetical protein
MGEWAGSRRSTVLGAPRPQVFIGVCRHGGTQSRKTVTVSSTSWGWVAHHQFHPHVQRSSWPRTVRLELSFFYRIQVLWVNETLLSHSFKSAGQEVTFYQYLSHHSQPSGFLTPYVLINQRILWGGSLFLVAFMTILLIRRIAVPSSPGAGVHYTPGTRLETLFWLSL